MKRLLLIFFCLSTANAGAEVVFNELMYDPMPPVALPQYEYIELFNRGTRTVDMREWRLCNGSKCLIIKECLLHPGQYLLLCYRGIDSLYRSHNRNGGRVMDILDRKTFLKNSGDTLYLLDADSMVMDWMDYSGQMHSDAWYGEGGWSLERIDPYRECHNRENWTSSVNRNGGSPGYKNSVHVANPDRETPEVASLYMEDSMTLRVIFNESLEGDLLERTSSWRVDPGVLRPHKISMEKPFRDRLKLGFAQEFIPGREYRLVNEIPLQDCSGNTIPAGSNFPFARAVMPGKGDILISEVLFNPLPWCPEFIEIHNPGPLTYDLSDLCIMIRGSADRGIESPPVVRLHDKSRLTFQGDYIALTKDPEELGHFFSIMDPKTILEVNKLPSLDDREGTIYLMNTYLDIVDEMQSNRNMHVGGLPADEGVSLERVYFSGYGPGIGSAWHSAAYTEGYATPGRQNSQYLNPSPGREEISVEPKIFSPDSDGSDDLLMIKYHFPGPGYRARILVFDPRGRLVCEVARGELLGTEGFLTWDGTGIEGAPAPAGIYLVLTEVSAPGTRPRKYKHTCVLQRSRF